MRNLMMDECRSCWGNAGHDARCTMKYMWTKLFALLCLCLLMMVLWLIVDDMSIVGKKRALDGEWYGCGHSGERLTKTLGKLLIDSTE